MNNKYPTKFYGVKLDRIRTEADALAALDYFIRNADDSEVEVACHELEHMDNRQVRSIVRSLLWKLEYELSSEAWMRCFNLKYAAA